MNSASALPPTASAGFAPAEHTAARAARILSDLVGFETVSRNSNLDIVAYIAALLERTRVMPRIIYDATGTKASILASIGPLDQPGVVLSAHTDVVPADGQNWSTPPFETTVKDGRIYGRGTSDMKGFVAAVLAYVPYFCAADLQAPIHIAFSYDEELGCKGAPDLVRAVAALPVLPALCIVGEPTRMRVVHGHKGKLARRLTIRGRGGHSAYPHRAANAVDAAAEIVVGLRALARECAAERDAEGFDPPYTTVHVGSLHGGNALNLVPDEAVLEFEIRSTPRTDVGALLARIDTIVAAAAATLRESAPEARIEVETLIDYPGLDMNAESPETALVRELAATPERSATISFGTEAGLYAAAGIPTLVCGPGDIARAHIADEWIGMDELAEARLMLDRLTAILARPDWAASIQHQRQK